MIAAEKEVQVIQSWSMRGGCALGVAISLTTFTYRAGGATVTMVYSFTGGADGGTPTVGLAMDQSGTLFGTTSQGGKKGGGTVFKFTQKGELKVLANFPPASYSGGPSNVAIGSRQGDLYVGDAPLRQKSGIFRVSPKGGEKPLYFFDPATEVTEPHGLSLDSLGNLIGLAGGTFDGMTYDVFKINPAGQERVVASFSQAAQGLGLQPGFVIDRTENIYGAANFGGSTGYGLIFKLDALGEETALYNFVGGYYGKYPSGGLIADAGGNLYGVTSNGGNKGVGTIYRLSPEGVETVLYSFQAEADGGVPGGSLARDGNANLYGVTAEFSSRIGENGLPTVYELSPDGVHTVLWAGALDFPNPPLAVDASGTLYGTTYTGGAYGRGYIFKLTP